MNRMSLRQGLGAWETDPEEFVDLAERLKAPSSDSTANGAVARRINTRSEQFGHLVHGTMRPKHSRHSWAEALCTS
jgi:hypothetical protein